MKLRPLPAMNDNYTPAREWACVTREEHDCQGPVIGALGAVPVCANGEVAERDAWVRHQAHLNTLYNDPKFLAAIEAEGRMERRIEGGQR